MAEKSTAKPAIKKSTIIIAVIIGVVTLIALWGVGVNNSLVKLRESVDSDFAQIETTLQRRLDLIPNLVSTVKGYADHEESVFTAVAEARAKLAGAIDNGDAAAVNSANGELSTALGRLIAIAEAYPELKADTVFIGLQDELAGTENRINTARQAYNETVKSFNAAVKTFPNSIIAGMGGFTEKAYFSADPAAGTAPVVEF
jgi:LemA protein